VALFKRLWHMPASGKNHKAGWRLGGGRRRGAGERGQSLVLVGLMITSLLGAGGLALDSSSLYVARTNTQRTADAAALAGARTVLTSETQGVADAKAYAAENSDTTAQVTVLTTIRPHDTIRVTSSSKVRTSLLRVLGITDSTVKASGTAQVGPAGSAVGILPWAVNDDAFSGYGKADGLQPANGGGCGTFNFVAMKPPGGQTYADAIVNGVTSPIFLNTSYPTLVSDGSGLSAVTRAALQARIDARPSETYSTFVTGSPRVVFIPVLNGDIPNAPSPVTPIGFRAFFLEKVDSQCAYGRFVESAIPNGGIGGINVPDKGVHVIKLIN